MNVAFVILQEHVATSVHQAADEFVKLDPYGIGMAIIAMTVVFAVLAIVYFAFKLFSKFHNLNLKKEKAVGQVTEKGIGKANAQSDAEVAIAMAIHLYMQQQQEMDNLTLTIESVSRRYSPWSSKIYTLRQIPRLIH